MSGRQEYRNYDYAKDIAEFNGYDELAPEEELSEKDQELMRDATVNVRAVLGQHVDKVTMAQIEESQWHNYYDINKTVKYLVKKSITAPKKEPAAPAKSGASHADDDVDNLSIDDLKINSTPLAKRKSLDVLSEYARVNKKRALLIDMDVVDQRTIN